ncbi:Prokaryotic metallothionein [Dactylosporangium sp. NPDC050588]|uniref:Prokaryotic metallothionein n=1 Tax=Dactylosporangium sp. NPDC050588 TaxID=3157211 RepID=UPI0033C39CB5
MAVCEACGNDYSKTFQVCTADGAVYAFDSFECAIHRLAPVCKHCGCRIVGHGVSVSSRLYCCAHCARTAEATAGAHLRDSVGAPASRV